MSRTFCAVFVLLCFVPLFAQRPRETTANPFPPQAMDDMKRVQQAALASDYAYQITAHLTDNIGPRLMT